MDTLLHIEGYDIHFKIIKGKGIPIVFENGANGDLTIWESTLNPISSITGATLITYDQVGLGKSSPGLPQLSVQQGIDLLDKALQRLDAGNSWPYLKLILVCTSTYK